MNSARTERCGTAFCQRIRLFLRLRRRLLSGCPIHQLLIRSAGSFVFPIVTPEIVHQSIPTKRRSSPRFIHELITSFERRAFCDDSQCSESHQAAKIASRRLFLIGEQSRYLFACFFSAAVPVLRMERSVERLHGRLDVIQFEGSVLGQARFPGGRDEHFTVSY